MTAVPPRRTPAVPPVVRLAPADQRRIDLAVRGAIEKGEIPGCVVLVGRGDGTVFRRAYGHRALEPRPEPMHADAIFDLASLTKPIATAGAMLLLHDGALLDLDAPVAAHLPVLARGAHAQITARMLLTHSSGLPAASALSDYDQGLEHALGRIAAVELVARPGTQYRYSDLGYVVLGALVERLARRSLAPYTRKAIFAPLGMSRTAFLPSAELRARAVPTERRSGAWLVGRVHDPRAARLGGVAGHAGLFSTADDLARFVTSLLHLGELAGRRVWSAATVREMLRPQGVPQHPRALGWDVVPIRDRQTGAVRHSLAHGGFTGTYLWLDPQADLFLIVLSSRLHPDGKGRVHELCAELRRIAVEALPRVAPPPKARVLTGVDVLRRDGFSALRGARVALITHAAAIGRDGLRTLDLLHHAPGVELVAVMTPEHGLDASADGAVPDGRDARTALPVYSLYGPRRAARREQLVGVDTIVVDLQDAGARFYTYLATLRTALETAAQHGLRIVVLDRPNPSGGVLVEGPLPKLGASGLLHPHPVPIRHGLTLGELARLIDRERRLGVAVEVIAMEGWRRPMTFADTGLAWVSPSPNLRSPQAAMLYPGVALLEMTNVSVGRGTDRPFELVGAPWMDGRLAQRLSALGLPGLAVEPARFTPTASKYAGLLCRGVHLRVTAAHAIRSVRTGLALAVQIRRLYGRKWKERGMATLLASDRLLDGIQRGKSAAQIEAMTRQEVEAFLVRRAAALAYR